jgi:hypothetical protein
MILARPRRCRIPYKAAIVPAISKAALNGYARPVDEQNSQAWKRRTELPVRNSSTKQGPDFRSTHHAARIGISDNYRAIPKRYHGAALQEEPK